LAMAERAGLTRIEGPWQSYPERMLRMRARSWTMRDGFADVLRGVQLREEVEDYAGSRTGRPRPTPHRETSPPGSLHAYSSPRPKYRAGSNGAGRLDERPTAELPPPSRDGEGEEPSPVEETNTLIDADGVVSEVIGADALRAAFERLLFDEHLSADQVAGVWETNEPARHAIERLFGPEVLTQAQEHLRSLQGVRSPPSEDQPEPAASPRDEARSRERPGRNRLPEPDRVLVLEVNPTWGVQKIFHHYRAALSALSDARDNSAIGRFRQANIAVEQRLRAKLSSRIGQIDAIYQRAGLES
jgi:hypothetical protein